MPYLPRIFTHLTHYRILFITISTFILLPVSVSKLLVKCQTMSDLGVHCSHGPFCLSTYGDKKSNPIKTHDIIFRIINKIPNVPYTCTCITPNFLKYLMSFVIINFFPKLIQRLQRG